MAGIMAVAFVIALFGLERGVQTEQTTEERDPGLRSDRLKRRSL